MEVEGGEVGNRMKLYARLPQQRVRKRQSRNRETRVFPGIACAGQHPQVVAGGTGEARDLMNRRVVICYAQVCSCNRARKRCECTKALWSSARYSTKIQDRFCQFNGKDGPWEVGTPPNECQEEKTDAVKRSGLAVR